jgi:hypothetical protein
MTQNLASLNVTDAQLTNLTAALTVLETEFGLVSLSPGQRRVVPKMGVKSETFCRQALNLLEQNPQLVSPAIGLPEAQADLASLDQLRPLFLRLERLGEKASDTAFALGSDVMSTALKGYAALKSSGRSQGLDAARKSLAVRFAKSPRSEVTEPATPPAGPEATTA